MSLCFRLGCSLALFVLLGTPPALAASDEAAAKVALGSERLAQADFEGALKAFTAAAKAEPEDPAHQERVALLQRVIQMRQSLDRLEGGPKWASSAEALHTYYLENRIYKEALALNQKVHAKLGTGESAARLARTKLALGMNAEAADLLGGLTKDRITPETRLLLALALARQGKADPARAAVADFVPPEGAPGLLYFDLACVRARLGDADEALRMLRHCLEATAPARLEAVKMRITESEDLASLRTKPEYAKVMAIESKVTDSKCSEGPSCGKCPSRTTCAGEKKDSRQAGSDGAGCPENEKPKP